MIDLPTIAQSFTHAIEAPKLPERAPWHVIDSVVHAVARRLPGVSEKEIATALPAWVPCMTIPPFSR